MWSVARLHLLLLLSYVASQSLVFYDNLPDGMNEVLVSHYGGLLITGFDSRRRVCLVLFAPPFGRPLRTVAELPYRDSKLHRRELLSLRHVFHLALHFPQNMYYQITICDKTV